ncbi:MAG: hypothetical protein ACRC5H_01135, partial [Treponemataceae bacterium]
KKFSSFTAIGNSAVAITWEDFNLDPEGEKSFSYYITTANSGADAPTDLSNAMLGRAFLEKKITPYIANFYNTKMVQNFNDTQTLHKEKMIAHQYDYTNHDLFFSESKRRKEKMHSA